MKKGIIILMAVLSMGTLTFAQKLAHVDYVEVTDSLPSMRSANKQLEDYYTEQAQIIQDMQEALETDYATYLGQKDSLNEIFIEMKEEKFVERQQEIAYKQQALEQDLQKLNQRLFQPIQDRLTAAVKVVADRHGVTYVLEASQILYVGDGKDLTDEVKAEMLKTEPESDN
ncbi:MAG: OmpH family outer membrane protein [Flavobacteriales bacterium]|nr:OmpH family outer membrane protein [Flavobacteriales bacterium]